MKGRGGHAAHPDQLIDPLAAGIQLCNDLQYIVSRKTSALSPAVLSITMFNAGETNNVIPDTCKIGGTIRTFDSDTQTSVIEGFKKY